MSERRVFTFGHGQPNFPGYVVVFGETGAHCRDRMIQSYGTRWSMEYRDEIEAGVYQFNLPCIATIGDPPADLGPAYPEPECWGETSYEHHKGECRHYQEAS